MTICRKPETAREKIYLAIFIVCFIIFIIFLASTIVLVTRKCSCVSLHLPKRASELPNISSSSEVPNSSERTDLHNAPHSADFPKENDLQYCFTPQCLKSAEVLLNSMDQSVDPCDDFYLYSCGNWINNHQIIKNKSVTQDTILQDKIYNELRDILDSSKIENSFNFIKSVIRIYRSCLNSRNSNLPNNFFQLLNDIGGLPLKNESWKPTGSINQNIAKAILLFKVEPLLKLNVKPDDTNTTQNIIKISQPINKNFSELINFLELVLPKIKIGIKDLSQMKKLDKIIQDSKKYNSGIEKLKIKDFNTKTKSNDWLEIIQIIMKDNWIKLNITEEELIEVDNINYFINLIAGINKNKIDERTIANYIGTYVAYVFFTTLEEFEYLPNEEVQPWKPCIQLSVTLMPLAIDHLYIKNKNFEVKDAEIIVEYLKIAFKEIIAKSTLLDNHAAEVAYEKLEAMHLFSGYSQILLNTTFLDTYHKQLPSITDDIVLNLRNVIKFIIAKQFSRLRQYNTQDRWIPRTSITAVNAFYVPIHNSIIFPAAIQNLPYYDWNRPWYLNFGAIGSIIGHELTHGFDNQGSHRDKSGKSYNWWNPQTKKKFGETIQCFVDQYNNYLLAEINEKINGIRTFRENIADNSGLRQAYQAYQAWEKKHGKEKLLPGFTESDQYQLFFLAFANIWCSYYSPAHLKYFNNNDYHAIGKYRVIGSLSNMKEFSEAFNCKKGSRMNPKKKCLIW